MLAVHGPMRGTLCRSILTGSRRTHHRRQQIVSERLACRDTLKRNSESGNAKSLGNSQSIPVVSVKKFSVILGNSPRLDIHTLPFHLRHGDRRSINIEDRETVRPSRRLKTRQDMSWSSNEILSDPWDVREGVGW